MRRTVWAAAVVVGAMTGFGALASGFEATKWSIASQRLAGDIDRVATTANVRLSPEGKDVLVRETLRRGAAAGAAPDEMALPEGHVKDVTARLATKVPDRPASARDVEAAIVTTKASRVETTLSQDIYASAQGRGVKPTKTAHDALFEDLKKQTGSLAKSGFSSDQIKAKNLAYLNAVYAGAPKTGELDRATYTQVRTALFQELVRLTILSEPAGAEVQVAGAPIGKTAIDKKPMQPGKEYQFTFRLSGYKEVTRFFYVTAGDPEQICKEILLPAR
jgi:hypothetical protein